MGVMAISPAADLLAVVRAFLEEDILRDPALSDDKRFNLRVAVNLLAMVERELHLAPGASVAEAEGLTALVGGEGTSEERNRRLSRAIREVAVAGTDPQLLDHLHRTIVDALRINNPKWLER